MPDSDWFPSPCGELRVSDTGRVSSDDYDYLEFPSPCGELRVSDV